MEPMLPLDDIHEQDLEENLGLLSKMVEFEFYYL